MNNLEKGILTKIATAYPMSLEEIKRIYERVKSFDKTIEVIEEMYRTAIGNPTIIIKHLQKQRWEKEFEDIIDPDGYSSVDFIKNNFEKILKKYNLLCKKIKVKCKDGCIQIERIK